MSFFSLVYQQKFKCTLYRILISQFSTSLLDLNSYSSTKPTFSFIFQQCAKRQDLKTGQKSHAQMIVSGFVPSIFVSNCLVNMYVKCKNLDHAYKAFTQMPVKDNISWNALISGYCKKGLMETSRSLFDEMQGKDVITWNSIISGYLQNDKPDESINLFFEMMLSDVHPDHTTFGIVLKACSFLGDYYLGCQIHGMIVKLGLDYDVFASSAVLDMYAKCKSVGDAFHYFNQMKEKNWVSWSAMIGGFVQNGRPIEGLEVFKLMLYEQVSASQSCYASVFRSCAELSCSKIGSHFHGHALKTNFSHDIVVGTSILDMYAKCDSIDDAVKVFRELPTRRAQTWNAIIVGSVRNRQGLEAMTLFRHMHQSIVSVDEISLSSIFSACAETKGYLQGAQAHSLAIKTNFISYVSVANAVLDMYGKCGALKEACGIFEEMKERDAISWNAIITAFEQNGIYEETFLYFDKMLTNSMEPDEFTYGSVLKACAALKSLDFGMKVHDKVIKSGLGFHPFVGSALIDMYSKCGLMEEAQKLHCRLETQTLVSWNALISGFSLQKQSEEALKSFSLMLNLGLQPDNFTYATVLDTCANLAMSGLGKQMHSQIIKHKLHDDIFISSTIVDMYAKCGLLHESLLMFEKMRERDFVSWNALICGYSQHGYVAESIEMFERMQSGNVKPNHATFVSILRACAHVGLIDEGERYFDLMTNYYKLEPHLDHYSCMVDVIGRTKGVYEALKIINDMTCDPDAIIWRTLLNVCKIHQNVDVAEVAAAKILLLDPEDSSSCITLSNIYADAGKWEEVLKLRKMMREGRMKKEPGCSWIEIRSEMHAFLVGDKAHPKCGEIYKMLHNMTEDMRRDGYMDGIELFCDDKHQ